MASLVTRPGGEFWIQVKVEGTRKTIRLGKVPRRAAEEICRRVETLNACRLGGVSLDEATATWVGKIGSDLSSRLAACGLIETKKAHTMTEFLKYVWSQMDVKESTLESYEHVRRNLLAFFGPDRQISSITEGDADEFCRYLVGLGLSKATVAGRSRRARQFFTVARKKKWIPANPFDDIRPGSQTNPERQQYVPMEHVLAVIEEMPNDEYKAILAMARIAGMRVPSEPLSLKWEHINWGAGTMAIYAPKTGLRTVPIFEQLRPYIERLWDAAGESPWVINRYRNTVQAISSIVTRGIGRAGVPLWPKLFQNLRASAETDLMEKYPLHVVCQWIGNSPRVAAKHYLMVTRAHIEQASGARKTIAKSEASGFCQKLDGSYREGDESCLTHGNSPGL